MATVGRFQITTDGFMPYRGCVPDILGDRVDFGQLIKIFAMERVKDRSAEARYSPAPIKQIRKEVISGNPDKSKICTSHVERNNLSIRMGIRRFTRLTNAFSKKFENHRAAVAIWFVYYNFCRVHMTIKTTPAVASGIATEPWTVERMLNELAEVAYNPATQ